MNTEDKSRKEYQADNPEAGSSNRSFGLVFTGVFGLIGAWPLLSSEPVRWWATGCALALAVIALAVPDILAGPNRLWTKFGLLLHRIINPIILGILFLIAFVPMAIWLRIVGRRPIRQLSRDEDTFWRKPERTQIRPDSFRKLY